MATQTFQVASFGGGAVRVEIDINDANWRPSKVRCVNDSAHTATAMIYEGGVQRFTANALGNQTTEWNISGVQLGWDATNGGLMMGNYTMQARWPG
jgi:hypothetical protein